MGLFKKAPRAAAEISADLAAADEAIRTAEETLAAREAERKALLAEGSDAELERADSAVLAARQALETRRERRTLLETLRAEAVAREAAEAAEARRAKVLAVRKAGLALYDTYRAQAEALAATLTQLHAAECYIAAFNERDGEATGGRLPGLNAEFRCAPEESHTEQEVCWQFEAYGPLERAVYCNWVRSSDGALPPFRPEPRRYFDQSTRRWSEPQEPTLLKRDVRVTDRHFVRLDPIEQIVERLPGVAIGDPDLWGEAQRRAARANAASIAEGLLPRGKKAAA